MNIHGRATVPVLAPAVPFRVWTVQIIGGGPIVLRPANLVHGVPKRGELDVPYYKKHGKRGGNLLRFVWMGKRIRHDTGLVSLDCSDELLFADDACFAVDTLEVCFDRVARYV